MRQPRRGAGARVSHKHPKEVHTTISLKTNALAAGNMDYMPLFGSEFNTMSGARELRHRDKRALYPCDLESQGAGTALRGAEGSKLLAEVRQA